MFVPQRSVIIKTFNLSFVIIIDVQIVIISIIIRIVTCIVAIYIINVEKFRLTLDNIIIIEMTTYSTSNLCSIKIYLPT